MKKEAYILLHDIRSVFNVGAIFRTADALGITKIYVSGFSPTPLDRFGNERKDFVKVSLGAEKTVSWEYVSDPFVLINDLKNKGMQIIAVEQNEKSVDYKEVNIKMPTLFIFGREVEGIEKDILEKADVIAEIPMMGKKESLNVAVSAGIVVFRLLDK